MALCITPKLPPSSKTIWQQPTTEQVKINVNDGTQYVQFLVPNEPALYLGLPRFRVVTVSECKTILLVKRRLLLPMNEQVS